MRRLLLLCSAAAISLAMMPGAQAQTRGDDRCTVQGQSCMQPGDGKAGKSGKQDGKQAGKQGGQQQAGGPAKKSKGQPASPRTGESGRGGQPFERASNSRFKAPPRGQEYRVVNEHLVLIDKDTLKIVTVVGLLNSLLK